MAWGGAVGRTGSLLAVPLKRAMICLDCECVSLLSTTCGVCDSPEIVLLTRWLERGGGDARS